jgi:Protein of unknown function (DUF4238)
MNDPIRHHYSPQFYLRQWAGADARLTRYYRPQREVIATRCSPRGTGFEDYLYTVDNAPRPQFIETDFFGRLDDAAAPLLDKFINLGGGITVLRPNYLSAEERSDWVRFISSLQLRGPHSLDEIKGVLDRNVRDNIQREYGATYRARRRSEDPLTAYDFMVQNSSGEFQSAHKLLLAHLIDHEPIGQVIVNMIWAVFDVSTSPYDLLTSDRPYCTSHGIGDPSCVLSIPLSPTRLFVAVNDERQLYKLNTQSIRDIVRNSNTVVVKLAVQNVYGRNNSHLVFVEKWLKLPSEAPVPGLITL